MDKFLTLFLLVTVVKNCCAEGTLLDTFLTSGFSNKEAASDNDQDQENRDVASANELIQFMRRAGFTDVNNQFNNQQVSKAGQSITSQQPSYLPQQSQLNNYVTPKRQVSEQLQQYGQQREQLLQEQQQRNLLQQLLQYQQQLQSQQSVPQSTNAAYPEAATQSKTIVSAGTQQDNKGKTKAVERQGLYGHEPYDSGYSVSHSGYEGGAPDEISDHADGYSAGGGHHYGHEPVAYKPEIYVPPPKPAVAINFDPLRILRILLQGIPRPLLNLNGKVFFGVELGKHAGLGVGKGGKVGYAAPHQSAYAAPHQPAYGGGKGLVLNLG